MERPSGRRRVNRRSDLVNPTKANIKEQKQVCDNGDVKVGSRVLSLSTSGIWWEECLVHDHDPLTLQYDSTMEGFSPMSLFCCKH